MINSNQKETQNLCIKSVKCFVIKMSVIIYFILQGCSKYPHVVDSICEQNKQVCYCSGCYFVGWNKMTNHLHFSSGQSLPVLVFLFGSFMSVYLLQFKSDYFFTFPSVTPHRISSTVSDNKPRANSSALTTLISFVLSYFSTQQNPSTTSNKMTHHFHYHHQNFVQTQTLSYPNCRSHHCIKNIVGYKMCLTFIFPVCLIETFIMTFKAPRLQNSRLKQDCGTHIYASFSLCCRFRSLMYLSF